MGGKYILIGKNVAVILIAISFVFYLIPKIVNHIDFANVTEITSG